MNAQERDLLWTFLGQMARSPAPNKDPVADQIIQDGLASIPDAHYRLVQQAMGAGFALRAAQARILQLEAELGKQGSARGDFPAFADAAVDPTDGGQAVGRQSRFMRDVLTTAGAVAVGVAAGGFLYDGLKSALDETGMGDAMPDLSDWL